MAQPGFALVNIADDSSGLNSRFVTIKNLKTLVEATVLAADIYIWTGRAWVKFAEIAETLVNRQLKIIPTEFPVTDVTLGTVLGKSNIFSYGTNSSCVYLGTTANGLSASQAAHSVSKVLNKSYKQAITTTDSIDVGLDSADIASRIDRSPLGYAKGTGNKSSAYDLGRRDAYCLSIGNDADGVFWCNGAIVDTDLISAG
jgi:hypothetical protein